MPRIFVIARAASPLPSTLAHCSMPCAPPPTRLRADHRLRALRLRQDRPLRRSHRPVRRVRTALSRRGALHRLRHHARRPADEGAGGVAQRRADARRRAKAKGLPVVLVQGGIHAGEIDGKDAGFLALRQAARRRSGARARSTSRCCCSCRCSTSTATSASAPGTAPTSAARRRWAGAPRRRTTTSTATTSRPTRRRCRRCCALVDAWDPLAYDRPARDRRRQVRARRLDPGRARARRRRARCARPAARCATA